MRLPWRHPNQTRMAEEAREARERAEAEYAKAQKHTSKFQAVARQLAQVRQENHLREAFEATFGGTHEH